MAGIGGSLREQPWGSQSLGVVSHLGLNVPSSEVRSLLPEILVWTSVAEFTHLVQVTAPSGATLGSSAQLQGRLLVLCQPSTQHPKQKTQTKNT